MLHQLKLLDGRAGSRSKQSLEPFAVKIGRTSVDPNLDRLAVQRHLAVLVDHHARSLLDKLKSVATLSESTL